MANGKSKVEKLVDKWIELKDQISKIEEEQKILRGELLGEVNKEYPDKSRSARVEVGAYNVIRSSVPKITWDLMKLKDLVGKTIYEQVIKTKVTVDEDKVEQKINEGKIEKKDITKACEVNYQERLLVNLKGEKEPNEKPRELITLLDA